jgi:hypothetical protein
MFEGAKKQMMPFLLINEGRLIDRDLQKFFQNAPIFLIKRSYKMGNLIAGSWFGRSPYQFTNSRRAI